MTPANTTDVIRISYFDNAYTLVNVSDTDLITAVKTGTAKLRVSSGDEYADITLTIVDETTPIESPTVAPTSEPESGEIPAVEITLSETEKTLYVGESYQIGWSVTPADTTDEIKFYYTGYAQQYVKLSNQGVVTAKTAGEAKIRVKSGNASATMIFTIVEDTRPTVTPTVKPTPTPNIPTTEIALAETEKTLHVGDTYQIGCTVTPADTTDALSFAYVGDARSHISVSRKGLVTAKASGTASIRVYSGSKSADISFTIIDDTPTTPSPTAAPTVAPTPEAEDGWIHTTELTLAEYEKTLYIGESYQIGWSVLPADTMDEVSFGLVGNAQSRLTLSNDGFVTAKYHGTAQVRVYSGSKSANITFTILDDPTTATPAPEPTADPETGRIPTVKVTVPEISRTMHIGETYAIEYTVAPANTTDEVSFVTSNDKYVSLSETGVITANKSTGAGWVTITVCSGDKKASFYLSIVDALEPTPEPTVEPAITLSEYGKTLYVGDTYPISWTLTPAGAEDAVEFTYVGDSEKVVSVSESGLVTAREAGTGQIRVSRGSRYASITFTVLDRPEPEPVDEGIHTTALTVTETARMLHVGESYQINCSVSPADTTDEIEFKCVGSWRVSVSESGLVTATKVGTTVVRVQSGSKFQDIIFTIVEAPTPTAAPTVAPTVEPESDAGEECVAEIPTAITNLPSKLTITKAHPVQQLRPNTVPGIYTDRLTYKSYNPEIATVSEDGTVTGVSTGKTTIKITLPADYARNADGTDSDVKYSRIYASVNVYVDMDTDCNDIAPERITVTPGSVVLTERGATAQLHAEVYPADPAYKVEWSCSSSGISVSDTGLVTANSHTLSSTVTARVAYWTGEYAYRTNEPVMAYVETKIPVPVRMEETHPEEIIITADRTEINSHETVHFTVKTEPEGFEDDIVWYINGTPYPELTNDIVYDGKGTSRFNAEYTYWTGTYNEDGTLYMRTKMSNTIYVTGHATKEDCAEEAAKLAALVNEYRESLGLMPYIIGDDITEKAQLRAAELAYMYATTKQITHTRPNGESGFGGENACKAHSAQAAFDMFRKSEAHNRNMTGQLNTCMGVGFCEYEGDWFVIQVFRYR